MEGEEHFTEIAKPELGRSTSGLHLDIPAPVASELTPRDSFKHSFPPALQIEMLDSVVLE